MNDASVWAYFLQVLPVSLIAGIVYAVVRFVKRKRKDCPIRLLDETITFLFVCYLTGLISLVVLPVNFWLHIYDGIFLGWWNEMPPIFSFGGFNLVPTIIKALSGEIVIGSWVKTMLIGNIAMFLPLGFFLPFVTEKVNRKNIFAVAAVVPFIAELLQMIFGRSFDVDDLICNYIGIVAGFFVGLAIRNIKGKNKTPDELLIVRSSSKTAEKQQEKPQMKKWIKVLIIVLVVLFIFVVAFLWVHGFQITKFLPRRGYA
ncbi:MAG: VanZ family protein [Clostridia bacterium]|nr:VanZ family protein [Clostridia bacterium]